MQSRRSVRPLSWDGVFVFRFRGPVGRDFFRFGVTLNTIASRFTFVDLPARLRMKLFVKFECRLNGRKLDAFDDGITANGPEYTIRRLLPDVLKHFKSLLEESDAQEDPAMIHFMMILWRREPKFDALFHGRDLFLRVILVSDTRSQFPLMKPMYEWVWIASFQRLCGVRATSFEFEVFCVRARRRVGNRILLSFIFRGMSFATRESRISVMNVRSYYVLAIVSAECLRPRHDTRVWV